MWVFVDVDGTLIDKDDNLRPYIIEFFTRLKTLGCTTVVWSAGGADYAESKFNMIAHKLSWLAGPDIRPLVHTYLCKKDSTQAALILKSRQFYVDDVQGLLDNMASMDHGTFKVPFYESTLGDGDNWLLRALTEIERVIDEEVHGSVSSDDGNQSSETQKGVGEGSAGSSDEVSDAAARDRLRRISEGFLGGSESQDS